MAHVDNNSHEAIHQRQRIALAVLADIDGLRRTINDLAAIDLPGYELVIVAERDALDGQLTRFLSADQSTDMPTLLIRNDDEEVIYADEPVRSGILADLFAYQFALFETWATPDLASDLGDHLHAGACVLIAPVTHIEKERPITEIFLDVSIASVQLHDITSVAAA